MCWSRCTGSSLPDTLPVSPHVDYRIPPYDIDAFLIEVELLLDWYLPRFGIAVTDGARARPVLASSGAKHLQPALDAPPTWVLRDFHSPNLLWLPRARPASRGSASSISRTR